MPVLRAFSVDHAASVTGLSKARLTRWDKLGFFSPEYLDEDDRGNPYARVYSYIDLVGLRTLKILADDYAVPLSELSKAAAILAERCDRPWVDIPLAVLKRKVVVDLENNPVNVTDGQAVLKHIPLPSIAKEVAKKAEELRNRANSKIGTIERRRYVAHNAYVIGGTRIPVKAVASFIEDGFSDDAILAEYPSLAQADIKAVRNHLKVAA